MGFIPVNKVPLLTVNIEGECVVSSGLLNGCVLSGDRDTVDEVSVVLSLRLQNERSFDGEGAVGLLDDVLFGDLDVDVLIAHAESDSLRFRVHVRHRAGGHFLRLGLSQGTVEFESSALEGRRDFFQLDKIGVILNQ